MQLWHHLAAGILRQTTRRFVWAPVFFATGIGVFFALKQEPSLGVVAALAATAFALFVSAFWMSGSWRLGVNCCVLVALGVSWAALRSQWVSAPVLEKRTYGPVMGVVYARDTSASGNLRLWLKQAHLPAVDGPRPNRVRVSVSKPGDWVPQIGQTIQITAHLSPPPRPAEPGGFDFQRHAWFLQLGAVGYARAPPVLWDDPTDRPLAARIERLRHAIADALQDKMRAETAGIATAITVGLRHSLDEATQDVLRKANLAHLLAISGLHMGLLTAIIFFCLRAVLALNTTLAVQGHVKPAAALAALGAGAVYLVVSGQSIATERAFVMAAVAFVAILVNRRALSLRSVAAAMWVVLLLRPHALLSPGFQMSFAATAALIVGFQALQKTGVGRLPGPLRWLVYSIASAGFAGLATAPFAAAHFNMWPHYGIVANVLAVPLMGTVVMPGILLALAGAPLGLEGVGLWVADWGLRWIIAVAQVVVAWDGSFTMIKSPPPGVLSILAVGFTAALILVGRSRAVGVAVFLIGAWIWAQADRPHVLISDSAKLVGTMTPQGRHVSREKGQGFVARVWLENDGDVSSQQRAFRRTGAVDHVRILKELPPGPPDCTAPFAVVADWVRPARCDVLDLRKLSWTGAWAGYLQPDGTLKWKTARDVSGRRLWNDRRVRRNGWFAHQ